MLHDKWDRRFYAVAGQVAHWSKDPTKRVGAVLVSPDRKQVAWGFNGFPAGLADTRHRLDTKSLKNSLMLHAEFNAILNCHVRPEGWTLYVTEAPCLPCALAIIQVGVARVVAPTPYSNSDWYASQADALEKFEEAGVKVNLL